MPEPVPERPLDLLRLFETFDRHGVAYLVVGGVAVQVHGHRRTTKDPDVLPAPSPGNHERLAAALDELEARQRDLEPGRVEVSATKHGEVHVLHEPKGGAPYEELRGRALVIDLDGVEIGIVGLDDLIRMKRAAGRAEDLEDIAVLTAVEREVGDL